MSQHQLVFKEIEKFYTSNNLEQQKIIVFTSHGTVVTLGKRNAEAKLWQNLVTYYVEQHFLASKKIWKKSSRSNARMYNLRLDVNLRLLEECDMRSITVD